MEINRLINELINKKMKIKNKIKALTVCSMLFFSGVLFAEPILVFSENAEDYKQTETGYILQFNVDATAIEMDNIQADIEALNEGFGSTVVTITSELISEGHYKCTYTVDHQNQPEYVHKMLLSSGFNSVKYQSQTHGLEKVIDILYAYQ